MKKNNLFVAWLLTAVIAMLEFSSCSNELAPEKPVREGMVDVIMTTSLPEVLQTYSCSNSAKGGLENLESQGLVVRYIMEVYTESGDLLKRKMIYRPLSSDANYRDAEFSARLFAGKYTFVFWADIVKKVKLPESMVLEGLSPECYANAYFFSNTYDNSDVLWRPNGTATAVKGDLQAIRASEIAESMAPQLPEMYDGYACVQEVDLTTESTTQDFTLTRPFAKLRIITTDVGTTRTPDYEKTVTLLKSNRTIPTMFNAREHKYSMGGDDYRGYWATVRHQTGVYTNESREGDDHTLGVFYLPISDDVAAFNLDFYFDVYDAHGDAISKNVHVSVPNVPLMENHLTTIKGNLLANTHTLKITINDEFDGNMDLETGQTQND